MIRVLATAIFVVWSLVFIYRTSLVAPDGLRYFSLFDDAMISMRYAWNLSHGHGLVWNPGEHVEGFTNLLMTLVMAVSTGLLEKRLAVLAIQLMGIPVVLGAALAADRLALTLRNPEESPYAELVGAGCFVGALLYYPAVYWTLMGMETGLVALFTAWALVLALGHPGGLRRAALLSTLFSLGYLARPDAVVLVAPLMAFAVWRQVQAADRLGYRPIIVMVGVLLLTVVASEAFRFSYYGEWVPNTYRLKIGGYPLAERLLNGSRFIRAYLLETLPFLVACGLLTTLAPTPPRLVAASVPVAALGYQVWAGGDAWDYWRLLAPSWPVLIAFFAVGMEALLSRLPRWLARLSEEGTAPGPRDGWIRSASLSLRLAGGIGATGVIVLLAADWLGLGSPGWGPAQRALLFGAACLALLNLEAVRRAARPVLLAMAPPIMLVLIVVWAFWRANVRFLPEWLFQTPPYTVEGNDQNILTAAALNKIADETAVVGVTWAGTIPYYTGLKAVDFLGKSDAYIAGLPAHFGMSGEVRGEEGMSTRPGHNKYDLSYSIQVLRPTYIMQCHFAADDVCAWADNYYVSAGYEGARLLLLRESPSIRWSLLGIEQRAPGAP